MIDSIVLLNECAEDEPLLPIDLESPAKDTNSPAKDTNCAEVKPPPVIDLESSADNTHNSDAEVKLSLPIDYESSANNTNCESDPDLSVPTIFLPDLQSLQNSVTENADNDADDEAELGEKETSTDEYSPDNS